MPKRKLDISFDIKHHPVDIYLQFRHGYKRQITIVNRVKVVMSQQADNTQDPAEESPDKRATASNIRARLSSSLSLFLGLQKNYTVHPTCES